MLKYWNLSPVFLCCSFPWVLCKYQDKSRECCLHEACFSQHQPHQTKMHFLQPWSTASLTSHHWWIFQTSRTVHLASILCRIHVLFRSLKGLNYHSEKEYLYKKVPCSKLLSSHCVNHSNQLFRWQDRVNNHLCNLLENGHHYERLEMRDQSWHHGWSLPRDNLHSHKISQHHHVVFQDHPHLQEFLSPQNVTVHWN